jgi:hypothetical protein
MTPGESVLLHLQELGCKPNETYSHKLLRDQYVLRPGGQLTFDVGVSELLALGKLRRDVDDRDKLFLV